MAKNCTENQHLEIPEGLISKTLLKKKVIEAEALAHKVSPYNNILYHFLANQQTFISKSAPVFQAEAL